MFTGYQILLSVFALVIAHHQQVSLKMSSDKHHREKERCHSSSSPLEDQLSECHWEQVPLTYLGQKSMWLAPFITYKVPQSWLPLIPMLRHGYPWSIQQSGSLT